MDIWKYSARVPPNLSIDMIHVAMFFIRASFYWHGLSLIPAWISNYIHYNVRGEITYPFLNFNGCTVEV